MGMADEPTPDAATTLIDAAGSRDAAKQFLDALPE
jgi:hypothetical protein